MPDTELENAVRHANEGEERRRIPQDLFAKPKSAKEQVYDFIKLKGRAKTHEIIAFGLSIYCNKADRWARELGEEGKVWRMREDVKMAAYGKIKEEVWSVYEADKITQGQGEFQAIKG